MRFPITIYKEDPEQTRLAEWHEVCYAFDATARSFVLLDKHGWWENAKGQAHFNVQVLYEPQKSEGEANTAMDARVQWLVQEGWTHKFTTELDLSTGRLVPIRIP